MQKEKNKQTRAHGLNASTNPQMRMKTNIVMLMIFPRPFFQRIDQEPATARMVGAGTIG